MSDDIAGSARLGKNAVLAAKMLFTAGALYKLWEFWLPIFPELGPSLDHVITLPLALAVFLIGIVAAVSLFCSYLYRYYLQFSA